MRPDLAARATRGFDPVEAKAFCVSQPGLQAIGILSPKLPVSFS
jgi:hypothetical protein